MKTCRTTHAELSQPVFLKLVHFSLVLSVLTMISSCGRNTTASQSFLNNDKDQALKEESFSSLSFDSTEIGNLSVSKEGHTIKLAEQNMDNAVLDSEKYRVDQINYNVSLSPKPLNCELVIYGDNVEIKSHNLLENSKKLGRKTFVIHFSKPVSEILIKSKSLAENAECDNVVISRMEIRYQAKPTKLGIISQVLRSASELTKIFEDVASELGPQEMEEIGQEFRRTRSEYNYNLLILREGQNILSVKGNNALADNFERYNKALKAYRASFKKRTKVILDNLNEEEGRHVKIIVEIRRIEAILATFNLE